jgi:predicted nucleic acid-binding protein
MQGNADASTHAADASHLSEAIETGCGYFITHDNRILKKRNELRKVIPPTLQIVSLAEFFQIVDDYDAGRQ